ncbi:MAG: SDR family oxidoreductase [Candidatus Lindowbacteria bacterium]|nr:SDR family oxidoreductase [Candidatus Lindowbacteria bacterium]
MTAQIKNTPAHVLVTGAAKRVGKEVALHFAKNGHNVTVHYGSSQSEAELLVQQITEGPGAAVSLQADITDSTAIDHLIAQSVEKFGPIDIAVLSASAFKKTPWETVQEEDWDFLMNVNLKSVFLFAKALSGNMNDGGSIITIGDWSGLRPYKNFLPYTVSKAGVVALTKALAQELAPTIRVNCVCPGTILPPDNVSEEIISNIKANTPLEKIGSPKDLVAAVQFLSESTDFATGTILVLDGGRLIADPGYG